MSILTEVTSANKDTFLERILNSDGKTYFNLRIESKALGISSKSMEIIIDQLDDLGLIKKKYFAGGHFDADPTGRGVDFYRRGGFAGQDLYLEQSLEKLVMETEKLKKELGPNQLDTINTLASIAANVGTFLSIVNGR